MRSVLLVQKQQQQKMRTFFRSRNGQCENENCEKDEFAENDWLLHRKIYYSIYAITPSLYVRRPRIK